MLPEVLLLGFAFLPWVWGAQTCQCRCTCLAEQARKAPQVPSRQTRQLRHSRQPRQRHRLRGLKSRSEEVVPYIIDHPSDLVVRWDQAATLNCRAAGNPTPTIEWYRNGEYVKTNKDDGPSQRTLLPGGSLFFLRLSQRKGKSDEGVYNCVARNHLGAAVSKNASLYVEALQEEFRLHPSNLVVTAGEQLVLECLPPRGHPEPTISWKKNGVPINEENGHYEVTNTKLLVAHALKSDAGAYVCMATNQVGERASRAALVSILEKPVFTRRPNDVVAKLGSTVLFMCGVHGDPTPAIQWHKETGELPSGRYEVNRENVLQIQHLTMNDAGKYVCTARNQVGTISAKASLTVQDPLDTGQSKQDRPKDVLKEPMEAKVYLANVTAVPSTPAAHLHWKVVSSSQRIDGYVVFYRSLLPVTTHWAEWHVQSNHRTIVPGLERGYKYEFKVQPYSGKVYGLDSNVRDLWIPEEVPGASPESISITTLQDANGTVIIHWEPPPQDMHNGIIKGYQVWFLGNETHSGSNRTVSGETHSLEVTGLANGQKYCVQVAAVNGAGIGVPSNPVCSAVEPTVEKMAKTPDFHSANYILEVVRQPVFIASVGSALWVMLMAFTVYVCQQQARQYGRRRPYALGEGLYRNASDDTIIKHRVDCSDSPWLSNTWKSTSGSKNYSTSSSLSSQLLWTEPKDNQEPHKSTASFDRQSQGSRIQTVPLVADSRSSSLYGALYVDLPVKDLKTFYNAPPPHLPSPSLHAMELVQNGDQTFMPHYSPNPWLASTRGAARPGPWMAKGSLSPNLIPQGSWDKNSKKELQQAHSTPTQPSSFSADWSSQGSQTSSRISSGKHRRTHGEMKKVLKTYSSPKFSKCSASQNSTGLLPPPPPVPPGFQAPQDHSTQPVCTCTCYLDPPTDLVLQQQDKDSLPATSESLGESHTFPTLPYSRLSAASISVSLNDDGETVLTPEEVAEYLELSEDAEHQRQQSDGVSAPPRVFSPPHTYGYICGPLASELLENSAVDDDDDPNMEEEGGCRSTKFFRSFCWTPSSSLSEDDASLGGSLLNGWGSVSEDNGTSTRCSLVSSTDGSFLVDASFAQALAVAVDSFCFGLAQRDIDKALTDILPSAPPLHGLLQPHVSLESSEEAEQKPPGSQLLPAWEWSTDWVDEVEAKYPQKAENWNAIPELGRGKAAAVAGETQPLTSALQGIKGACMSDSSSYPDRKAGAIKAPLTATQDSGSGSFAIPKRGEEPVVEKLATPNKGGR
ncbi:roundabout homolog 4 isoform X1 [Podarcis raffonei]|uniref:roundabout homolog 4 isoform X1 n=1 Tax=Podarcis raffonei TaxID=65483 RepID=UPI0023295AFB|nr:roundabout homolog 4 isoform X1 [Podarcis raffonei]XP_053223455.1 roundabout homolog 4 isoform X1 [Podarcis raffonei]